MTLIMNNLPVPHAPLLRSTLCMVLDYEEAFLHKI